VSYSQQERLALSELLEETGPDAPTLCEGWNTRDLVAHLVLRERRPDAAAGVMGGPVAGHTRRVQEQFKKRYTYPELIELLRSGPPQLSPFAIPGMDEKANMVEYFVHHEDVRRAAPGWEPRELSPGLSRALWGRLRGTRFFLRKAPVGIELAREDGGDEQSFRVTIRKGTPVVTVIGPPAELTMWATGRVGAARVRYDGTESSVAALRNWRGGELAAHFPLETLQVVVHVHVGAGGSGRCHVHRRRGPPRLANLPFAVGIPLGARELAPPGGDLDREGDHADHNRREYNVHEDVNDGADHQEHDQDTDGGKGHLDPAHPSVPFLLIIRSVPTQRPRGNDLRCRH
jgi:uncharacterized protein (TIGR03085 family)